MASTLVLVLKRGRVVQKNLEELWAVCGRQRTLWGVFHMTQSCVASWLSVTRRKQPSATATSIWSDVCTMKVIGHWGKKKK
ncbi:hypothetical protein KQX54_007669 [Cotesia glomerata]|uniref:Uncharacterized protein n=1 Tax=Cotesia glomerata TaxID=32391 RepID=A0AAV7HXF8_COTGL|nr:hypothetical protein KQX54_007669 [Cotesia glomerata]